MRRPSIIDLNELREDRWVGVEARRQRRRTIWLAVLAGTLLLASGAVYLLLRPPDRHASGRAAVLWCRHCLAQEAGVVAVDARFPQFCGACGHRTLVELWTCLDCGESFAPNRQSGIVSCPACGRSRVGSAAARPENSNFP